jgi:hypothetical protein
MGHDLIIQTMAHCYFGEREQNFQVWGCFYSKRGNIATSIYKPILINGLELYDLSIVAI